MATLVLCTTALAVAVTAEIAYGDNDRTLLTLVPGPMSAQHGADATGGAINMVTRSPTLDTGLTGNARLVAGAAKANLRTTGLVGAGTGLCQANVRHRISVERRPRGLFRYDRQRPPVDLNRLDRSLATCDATYRIGSDHQLRRTLDSTDLDDSRSEVAKHARLFGGGAVGEDIDIAVNHPQATHTKTYLLAQDERGLPGDWNLLVSAQYRAVLTTSIVAGLDNLFARRHPVNVKGRGSTIDPPTRFAYQEVRHAY